jgi:hypothetical protein
MTLSDDESDECFLAPDDVMRVGYKVIEMAERVRRMDKAVPGAIAAWGFEMDEDHFEVRVLFKEPRDG